MVPLKGVNSPCFIGLNWQPDWKVQLLFFLQGSPIPGGCFFVEAGLNFSGIGGIWAKFSTENWEVTKFYTPEIYHSP